MADIAVGLEQAGAMARDQIERAGDDPRCSRGAESPFGDFMDGLDEIARVRALAIWGLQELTHSVQREEAQLTALHDGTSSSRQQSLQAAWERQELAATELANGHAGLNAAALSSMCAALDALVERLLPAAVTLIRRLEAARLFEDARKGDPSLFPDLQPSEVRALIEAVVDPIDPPKVTRIRGKGKKRYEEQLSQLGLDAPADRQIPADMDKALTEAGVLRDVVVHRAGRLDKQAIECCPWLELPEGAFIRISDTKYRGYAAAVRTYGHEIMVRMSGPSPLGELNLERWRGNYLLCYE